MKKVGDLFAELGFRPEGSDSVKRAFVENLVKAASQNASAVARPPSAASVVPTPTKPAARTKKAASPETQLSFDFSSETNDPETPFPLGTKRSAG